VPTSSDEALLVGLDTPDDAAVYSIAPGVALVQTVDFFTPIVDDPFDWGRIAAANALSDVYAMGGQPRTAMNLVAWPRSLGFELLGRVLQGAGKVCAEAGVAIVGGHSVDDPEPKFGLAVTGTVDPDLVVRTAGASVGDVLVLTKPLGMGIISSGIKDGITTPETVAAATEIMARLNRDASEAMLETGVSAATDVTGFGLIGHLLEMLGDKGAELELRAIPVLPEAFALAERGILPAGSKRNREAAESLVDAGNLSNAQRAVLFDAQTSGGLLIAVSPDRADELMGALERKGISDAASIGRIVEPNGEVKVTVA
jgi:selenide, water dikinase